METAGPVASEEQELYEDKVRATFQETLGLIHIALVTHYGLQEGEAVEMEKDLYIWFLRFCIRRDRASARIEIVSVWLPAASSRRNTRSTSLAPGSGNPTKS